jgi:uncharacterized surface protein with fasciclin (FAS1) repeats
MTLVSRRGLFALAAAAPLAAPRLSHAQVSGVTLADTMAADSRFSRFLDLVTRASAIDEFRMAAPRTVFAPVDSAFAGAPAGLLQQMQGNSGSGNNTGDVDRVRVLALIQNHIVTGNLAAAEPAGAGRRLRTLNGGDIEISGTAAGMTVANPSPVTQPGTLGVAGANVAVPARVIAGPIQASNGIIYPVDQLIWP